MTDFAAQLAAFTAKVQTRSQIVFDRSVELARESIVDGSAITGAPGQPVATDGSPNDGELRDSWTVETTGLEATIASDCRYAPDVEDNVYSQTFANHGPHSLKLTVAGWGSIVRAAAAEVPS